ncbi:YegS/Rv2252/BmrU family lipid kinase [Candidatus Formimonas warabiya]|uniref:DAGKc domain-containing protein n=1 Tax=Formimonas warabiya TaxID=1761012 RepID=A0A3G1KXD0_FORW1|nr:YegS/Rv2252/BmrU family lipid kinase [Candidatus Formimonas warabiya]ATW26865.1 hypothetical protein DCMF_20730 [Candidatus Formimonas warabiya]
MEKIQLIYNPYSGTRKFRYLLDYTIKTFRKQGYEIHPYRTSTPEDFGKFIMRKDCQDYQGVIIAGGDGSVNLAVNALLQEKRDIPLGIIPAGTANDFATYLGIPLDLRKAISSLSLMRTRRVDVGSVNRCYFINVCSGGLLTNISQKVGLEWKNSLGKIAYYLKGMQELPNFRSMKLRITSPQGNITEDFYFFLVFNGGGAGGFTKLGGPAAVDDGKLDFVGLKAVNLTQLPIIFPKFILGEHIKDKRVIYFQTSNLSIERLEEDNSNPDTDVDGEKGPDYPLHISVLPRRLKVITPS